MKKKIEKIKLSDFWKKYNDQFSKSFHSAATTKLYNLSMRTFIEHVGDINMNKVNVGHIDSFLTFCISTKGVKETSANNYYRCVKAQFEKARVWGHINSNPFREVKCLKEPKRSPQFIQPERIKKFLDGIKNKERRNFVAALISTGRRRSEIVALEWSDIDFAAKKYTAHLTKTKAHRVFDINDEFLKVLIDQKKRSSPDGRVFPRWAEGTVTHWVKEEMRKAGIGHLHLHNCRHTFAALIATNGGQIFDIKELLGHANINTTMKYAALTEEHLKKQNNLAKFTTSADISEAVATQSV